MFVRVHHRRRNWWGWARPARPQCGLVLAALRQFEARLVGQEAARDSPPVGHAGKPKRAGPPPCRLLERRGKQALWDILGQSQGAPFTRCWAAPLRQRIRLYANINRHVRDRSPAGLARAARRRWAGVHGHQAGAFDELRAPDHVRTGSQGGVAAGVARMEAVARCLLAMRWS